MMMRVISSDGEIRDDVNRRSTEGRGEALTNFFVGSTAMMLSVRVAGEMWPFNDRSMCIDICEERSHRQEDDVGCQVEEFGWSLLQTSS